MNKSIRQKSQIIDDDSEFRYVFVDEGLRNCRLWPRRLIVSIIKNIKLYPLLALRAQGKAPCSTPSSRPTSTY